MASKETREAFTMAKEAIRYEEPELYSSIVKECVYRNGMCTEYHSCGYNHTEAFENELKTYSEILKAQINQNCNIHKNI